MKTNAPDLETVLVVSPRLNLRWEAPELLIRLEGTVFRCDGIAFAILERFRRPCTIPQAISDLTRFARGRQSAMDIMDVAFNLAGHGALVPLDAHRADVRQGPPASSFSDLETHIHMLADTRRTKALIAALRMSIRSDDVVLDIGTGSGVLAVAAALAGARVVYAVESGSMADVARDLAIRNGVGDRVRIIWGRSTEIELPERATFLVTEVIGNFGFDENILSTVADAKERLLTPDARLIPSQVRLFGAVAETPSSFLHAKQVDSKKLGLWQELYGIDFTPLAKQPAHRAAWYVLGTDRARRLRRLGPAQEIYSADLRSSSDRSVHEELELMTEIPGTANGVVFWMESDLGHGLTLSTCPWDDEPCSSWGIPFALLPRPFRATPGDRVRVEFSHHGSTKVRVQAGPSTADSH